MSLWQITLYSLFLTAFFGIFLFVGYTFRVRIRYPLALVTCHVVSALVTVVLFCFLLVQQLHAPNLHQYAVVVAWLSLVAILITFVSGFYFYLRYNVRRRGLRTGLLVTHLLMAAVSFVCAAASIAELSVPPKANNLYPGSMYNYYKHHNQPVNAPAQRK